MRSDESFRVVCSFDPAIDPQKCMPNRVMEYATKRDLKILEGCYKTGQEPMVFFVRPATRFHEVFIMGGTTDELKNERAFSCLVVKCSNFWTRDGRRVDKSFTSSVAKDTAMTDEELESVPWLVRQEIGQVAQTRALFLVPWIEPRYLVPPGSVSVLERKYESTSTADGSPVSSTRDTTETSSRPSTVEAESVDSKSDEPTAATAQETA